MATRSTEPYAASYPYRMRVRKKGRRTLEETLVRGRHHGEMPVVAEAEAPVAFRVTHANGAVVSMRAFDGAVWAPMRASDQAAMTMDKFRALLEGKGLEVPYIAAADEISGQHVFDPFSSCLVWQDGTPFGGHVVGGHISNNPEGPAGKDGSVVFDNGAQAATKAAAIAERLALIGGVVHLKVPAPMWQVTLVEGQRRRDRRVAADAYVSVRPEWRVPAIDERLENYAVCDFMPGPLQKEGNYFAWNRKADALESAKARGGEGGEVREEGSIEPTDRALALSVTVPGEDLAASAPGLLPEIVGEAGNRIHSMDDAAVGEWLALRRAVRTMKERWLPDETLAREAFASMDRMLECFRTMAKEGQSTTATKMLGIAGPAEKRWRAFEGTLASAHDHAERLRDDGAIASIVR